MIPPEVTPRELDPAVLISVVIPTITGRESWVRRCEMAYRETTLGIGVEIIIVKDEPSCGHAWIEGYRRSSGQYVHFTADDIIPKAGWYGDALAACARGGVPLADVRNRLNQAAWCMAPLGDMGHVRNVLVPFLSREQLARGGWLLPIHYGSDDWISYRAVQLGYPLVEVKGYTLIHLVADEGRDYLRRHGDVLALNEAMAAAGYVPPVYAQLEKNLRESTTGLDNVRINQLEQHVRAQIRRQRDL